MFSFSATLQNTVCVSLTSNKHDKRFLPHKAFAKPIILISIVYIHVYMYVFFFIAFAGAS